MTRSPFEPRMRAMSSITMIHTNTDRKLTVRHYGRVCIDSILIERHRVNERVFQRENMTYALRTGRDNSPCLEGQGHSCCVLR